MSARDALPPHFTKKHADALMRALAVALAAVGCAEQGTSTTPDQGSTGAPAATSTTPTALTSASASPSSSAAAKAVPPPTEPATDASAATAAPSASSRGVAAPTSSAPASATASAKPRAPRPRPPRPRVVPIIEGRPFLVHGEARLAAAVPSSEWVQALEGPLPDAAPAERALLAEHFTGWALAEHASIAAFARFSLQLLALGAPPELVERATQAMTDETRHARLGFALVHALADSPVGPGDLPIDAAVATEPSLAEVLQLTVREGMIGETLAALEVRAGATLMAPSYLRGELERVAADETRHAELAYVFAAWALKRDPKLRRIVESELAAWEQEPLPAAPGLNSWGVLDVQQRRAIRRDGMRLVVRPLVTQLLAATPPLDEHDPSAHSLHC